MSIDSSKKPIYESFVMLHPDGTFMCHISSKRANWYVSRNLATWVNDKTFKLNFEPKGKGKTSIPFYSSTLENRCVICGEYSDDLNRHHVVPYVFRSRFPKQYKESNHHDILVTCIPCHENYETHAMQYKIDLVKKYGLTMNSPLTKEQKLNKKIKSAIKILKDIDLGKLKDSNGIPFIPQENLNKLKELANQKLLIEDKSTNGTEWADKIVENILLENKLFEFIKDWRNHFIKYANPKFLPKYWSVEHPLEIIK